MLEFILDHISVQGLIWLIVAAPFVGFTVSALSWLVSVCSRRDVLSSFAISISVLASFVSLAANILVWYILYSFEGTSPSAITGPILSWMGILRVPLEFGLKVDQLALTFSFIIAIVGSLSHLYSVGFVSRDKNRVGYFSLLSLALSLALLLVLADSLFLVFVVWQIIGIVGYLLIRLQPAKGKEPGTPATGFYISDAISGLALLLVLFLVWNAFADKPNIGVDVFQFSNITAGVSHLVPYATVICFALLVCAMVRSVQFPLYIWLTHAIKSHLPAYMFLFSVVTIISSVYVLIRLNFLLVLSPIVLNALAVLGVIASLVYAVIAVVQKDIRKIIAYFVISQAGFALIGVGVGAFSATVFHIFTYVFYISCLFFGVGSVIAVTGEDQVDRLGGLKRFMPITGAATVIGALAAIGLYPLAGFYSKNGLLWEVYQRGYALIFVIGFLATGIGAIAIFRFVGLVFFGKSRFGKADRMRIEESSVAMLMPLVLMAFASVVVGWFGVSPAFGGEDYFKNWLEPAMALQMVHIIGEKGRFSELVLAVIVTLWAVHWGLVAQIVYVHKRGWPKTLTTRFARTYKLITDGFYINSIYRVLVTRPLFYFNEWALWKGLDRLIVGRVVVGSFGRMLRLGSRILNGFESRMLQYHILWVVVGLIVLVVLSGIL